MSVSVADIAPLPKPGDVIDSKYRVDHRVGSGAMSIVYQVTHRVTEKRFALKWLLPELAAQSDLAERFLREARVGGRFEHPNVVEVYDVGASNGGYYMVLELLSGESLHQRIQRAGALSWPDVCRLLLPCMRAVAEAHDNGIVHRDLKPANLFVCVASKTAPERAKVLDFGLAKVARAPGEQSLLGTRSGVVMGTPHYMPLEQMRGEPVDRRVDVYAFGVTLYQTLSGRLPYQAATFGDLVLAMASESPLPLERWAPALPDGVGAAIERALARHPAERYTDMNAFAEALTPFVPPGLGEESQRQAAVEVKPETSREPKASAARFLPRLNGLEPNRQWAVLLALIAVALLASIGVLRHGAQRAAGALAAPRTTGETCTGTTPCVSKSQVAAPARTQPIERTPRAADVQRDKWLPAAPSEEARPQHPELAREPDTGVPRTRARVSARSTVREPSARLDHEPGAQPSRKIRRQWRQARLYVANAPPPEPRAEEPRAQPSASKVAEQPNRQQPPSSVAQTHDPKPPAAAKAAPHTPTPSQPHARPPRLIRLMPLRTDEF